MTSSLVLLLLPTWGMQVQSQSDATLAKPDWQKPGPHQYETGEYLQRIGYDPSKHFKTMAAIDAKKNAILDHLKSQEEKNKEIDEDLKSRKGSIKAEDEGDDADDDDDDDDSSLLQTGAKSEPKGDGWTETGNLDPQAKSDFDAMMSGLQDLKAQMQKGMQNVQALKMKLDEDQKKHPDQPAEDSPHAEALLEVGTRLYKNMRDTREKVQALKAKLDEATAGAAARQAARTPEKASERYKKLDDNSLAVAIGAISGLAMGPEQATSLMQKFETTDTLSKAFKAGLKLGTNADMLREGAMSLAEVQSDPELLKKLQPFVPPGFRNVLQQRLEKAQHVEVAPDGNLRGA